jgi:peptidyl-prolyl cis-trans isomerase SurA
LKKILSFAGVLIIALTVSLSGRAEVVDRIVAFVNDEIITLSELNAAFEPYSKKIEGSYQGGDRDRLLAETKLTLLNRMIDNLLIEQEAKKSAIAIPDEEVMASIRGMLAKRKMTMEAFQQALAGEGTTFEAYKKNTKDSMVRNRLLRREVRARITVSDEEIGEYYRLHREDYEGKEAVKLKQILLLFPKNMDVNAKAKLQADATDILKRLRAGESFDILAAQFSQGPASSSGGDLGYVEKGAMLPEVENVAFRLEKNSISNLIESPVGFHILQVIDHRGEGIKPIETVREEIKSKLEDEKIEKKFGSWISELRAKSLVEIKL